MATSLVAGLMMWGASTPTRASGPVRPVAPDARPDPADARLEGELRAILDAPELSEAIAGVHVRSLRDGRTLFAHNAERLFNPASNMKLFTTAAALRHLGASYRFRTDVRRDRDFEGGVVKGNLYIRGRGDPTLTSEQLFGLVNQIALQGVREVKGNLVIDDTFFDGVFEGPGWEQEIGDHAYNAPIGALSVNFNTFEIHVLPGDRVGEPLQVNVWPDVPSLEVVSAGYTRGYGSRTRLWMGTSRQRDDSIRVTVRGSMAVNALYGRTVRSRVHNPTRYAGEMIERMLEMRGVRIRGRLRYGKTPERGTRPVTSHWSKPLGEIVSTLNKYSNNFIAEQVLKTVGAEMYDGPGSWESGNRAVRAFLTEVGIDADKMVLANGSGLNDVNRVTPDQVTRVLHYMFKNFELSPEFVSSLAVAGTSGTIRSRFEDSPAQSRLRAKTGSLTGVSALSGYVESEAGEMLAFSVMMNDYRGRARTMWGIQDQIGVALARYRGGTEAVADGSAAAP